MRDCGPEGEVVKKSVKSELLGQPHGTAANKLRKMLLFKYVRLAGHDVCYRCNKKIENFECLSIDHNSSWQYAENPRECFFDIDNVSFSHFSCNSGAAARPNKIYDRDEDREKAKRSRRNEVRRSPEYRAKRRATRNMKTVEKQHSVH